MAFTKWWEMQGDLQDRKHCPGTLVPWPLSRCSVAFLCRCRSRGDLWGRVWKRKIRSPFRFWEGNSFSPLRLAWNAIQDWEVWHSSSQGCVRIRGINISVIVCVWSDREEQAVEGCERRSRLAEAMSQKNYLRGRMAISEVVWDLSGSERYF